MHPCHQQSYQEINSIIIPDPPIPPLATALTKASTTLILTHKMSFCILKLLGSYSIFFNSMPQFIYSFYSLDALFMKLSRSCHEECHCEVSCTYVQMNIYPHFSWLYSQDWNCWVTLHVYVHFTMEQWQAARQT